MPGEGADTQVLVCHVSRLVRKNFNEQYMQKAKNPAILEEGPSKLNLAKFLEIGKSNIFKSSKK